MNMPDQTLTHMQSPVIFLHGSERMLFPELNSPVLIILKEGVFRPDEIARLESFLSKDETVKSRRFKFSRDRVSYIMVHGVLRLMLGRHLGISPQAVKITYNSFGRPYISGYSRQVFFNLSHSSGISVLAFDPGYEIGVDVERIDDEFEYESIVNIFFSKREIRYIQQVKEKSRNRFYEIWTRKEAFLKAEGIGITENLQVEVLKESIKGNAIKGNRSDGREFLFWSVVFEQNYRITLAMGKDSGGIREFVIGNNENGLPIRET